MKKIERDSGITDVADRRRMRSICVEMEKEEEEEERAISLLLLLRFEWSHGTAKLSHTSLLLQIEC